MSKFWGLLFSGEKTAGGHLGWEPKVLCTIHRWLGLLAWPWLAWLSSPRTSPARLACTSNNDRGAKRRAGRRRRPVSLLRGAGKASEAGTRRWKPSKPRPAKQAEPGLDGIFGLDWIFQNGLIGPLTAPNDVPISSPSGKFRGGAKYGPPGAPGKIKKNPAPGPARPGPMGPWALGPNGPMDSWALGPMGPLPMGPWAPGPGPGPGPGPPWGPGPSVSQENPQEKNRYRDRHNRDRHNRNRNRNRDRDRDR